MDILINNSYSLSDEQVSEVVSLYRDMKWSLNKIYVEKGIERNVSRKVLIENGIPIKRINNAKSIPEEQMRSIVAEYQHGSTVGDICERYHHCTSTVTRALKTMGIRIREPREYYFIKNGRSAQDFDHPFQQEIIQDYQSGIPYSYIAQKHKVDVRSIKRVLIKHGIPLRDRDYQYEAKKARKIPGQLTLIPNTIRARWKGNAEARGLEWSITDTEIEEKLVSQDWKCYYTGVKMLVPSYENGKTFNMGHPDSLSIDRIDSSKGYTKDNIVFCACAINYAKNKWSEQEFVAFLKQVVSTMTTKEVV